MRAKTFSRLALALALALASLASYANAANECTAQSSGRIRAQGFGLPQTQDLIEWYEGSSITVHDGDKVTGWTSSVAYDDGTGKRLFFQPGRDTQQLPIKRSEKVCERARRY